MVAVRLYASCESVLHLSAMGAERSQPGLGDVYSTIRNLRDSAAHHPGSDSYLKFDGAAMSSVGCLDRLHSLPVLEIVILGGAVRRLCVWVFALYARPPAGASDS